MDMKELQNAFQIFLKNVKFDNIWEVCRFQIAAW